MSWFSWFTGIGSLVGLVTGIIGAFKAFTDDRPYSYLEPDQVDGFLKLYLVNAGKRSIFIKASYVRPTTHWYVAPNASPMTGKGLHNTLYSKPDAPPKYWRDQNIIIEPGKRHEFFVGPYDRDAGPTWCLILLSWQPLGGLPIPRPPLLLYKSKLQIERVFLARKGKHDR